MMMIYDNVENDDGEDYEEWCQENPLARVYFCRFCVQGFSSFQSSSGQSAWTSTTPLWNPSAMVSPPSSFVTKNKGLNPPKVNLGWSIFWGLYFPSGMCILYVFPVSCILVAHFGGEINTQKN